MTESQWIVSSAFVVSLVFGIAQRDAAAQVPSALVADTYTVDNQLDTVTAPGVTARYVYDADGWRAKKIVGADVSYHLRGVHGELLTDWGNPAARPATASDYIYAGSRLVASVKHTVQ